MTCHVVCVSESEVRLQVSGKQCPVCGRHVDSLTALRRHYFRKHEPDTKKWPYHCAQCHKAFATITGQCADTDGRACA